MLRGDGTGPDPVCVAAAERALSARSGLLSKALAYLRAKGPQELMSRPDLQWEPLWFDFDPNRPTWLEVGLQVARDPYTTWVVEIEADEPIAATWW